ncbi:MAG TPA: DoxX family protein [Bryobacteraceae bacterium]|nr:DoxX family protein [Bryobacteraceae bacterium]
MSRMHYPLALLRIIIGWHFLYEGWAKLTTPGWSSASYLKFSTGPFGPLFHWMGANEAIVRISDQLNIWGLTLIGLALMLGVLIRPAALAGIGLLALYYLAYPPLFGPVSGVSEGQYLIVNKNLVELFALVAILAFPAKSLGIEALLRRNRAVRGQTAPVASVQRRELLAGLVGLPFLGAFTLAVLKKHGWKSFEEVNLLRHNPRDVAIASATVKSFEFSSLRDLKGQLPTAKIGNVTLSRMILGGNLIGGWAHARDLIYVSKLVKAYHDRNKVFETFDLAESCGVNTILTNPALCDVITQYWRAGGKIQFISDCGGTNLLEMTQKSIDCGACACYVQGGVADELVAKGRFDLIAKALDLVRKNGLPAGIGAHKLETVKGCVENGLRPDFWMKTLHSVDYWSARVGEKENDNIWCTNPEETIAYMRNLPEPWIAFKILAAGALEPKKAFKYAFENGADFICVGMYDFQIVEDVNLALEVLQNPIVRQRRWCS